jgi:hypothetical protein
LKKNPGILQLEKYFVIIVKAIVGKGFPKSLMGKPGILLEDVSW